ncbi:uncharacterized protein LOC6043240 [Culex quinquefasciatus]|uniref:uncharacterized protein LOC6043240 n=1 Tax=Culex quinquefasciatus TaxID=7176 RepID=UPI0018E32D46|nr:uncharacterized protein LOC6043240 [Culex quinquefasciatus]
MSFLIEHIQPKATKSNFSQQEKSPESFNGRSSSDRFAGETQSSKSFRGLTQSELAGNVIDVDYDVFLRDTLNLSPPKQPEEQPHCSYNPPKGYKPYEKELSSSDDDVAPKKSKSASDEVCTQEKIDYVAGDSGNEGNEGPTQPRKTQPVNPNRGRGRNKKTKQNPKQFRRREVANIDSSPERQDLEEGFYVRMTEAARSITNRFQGQQIAKEKPSDQDAIINHFCKMQKHMLRTINEDSRREYMQQCTNKLFDLCALEKHIL